MYIYTLNLETLGPRSRDCRTEIEDQSSEVSILLTTTRYD